MIATKQLVDAKLVEVGHEAGFGWADKVLTQGLAEDEIREVVALFEEPFSGWIDLTPEASGYLAGELSRWGLDYLDAGEPFCDGFVAGVLAARCFNA